MRMRIGLCLLLILLPACGRNIYRLVRTPEIYKSGALDPFEGRDDPTYRVFWATDRAQQETDDPALTFGGLRGDALRVGQATVRIGAKGQGWEEVVEGSLTDVDFDFDIQQVDIFGRFPGTFGTRRQEVPDEAGARFVEEIGAAVGATATKRLVVYIPGYNTSFATPINMAAQFQHFTGNDPVWLAFCWPARGGFTKYVQDAASSSLSVRRLRLLLMALAEDARIESYGAITYGAIAFCRGHRGERVRARTEQGGALARSSQFPQLAQRRIALAPYPRATRAPHASRRRTRAESRTRIASSQSGSMVRARSAFSNADAGSNTS